MIDSSGSIPDDRLLQNAARYAAGGNIMMCGLENNKPKTATKQKPNFVPNPNKRKGSENRQPTRDRERNVGHPNGEEHSRVPKGNNGLRRTEALVGVAVTSVVIVVLVADDATLVGVANDVLLAPTATIWWDYANILVV